MAKKRAPDVEKPIHVHGVTFQQRFVKCGKDRCRKGCAQGRASHGPYWYAFGWSGGKEGTGKERALYVGKQLPSVAALEQIADRLGARK